MADQNTKVVAMKDDKRWFVTSRTNLEKSNIACTCFFYEILTKCSSSKSLNFWNFLVFKKS